ncbi:ABC transporter ATP-binding protein [Oceanicella actignis]|uniref:Lipoprotein-releasing system ATP-binding protein n=1 Tax=Oceanicella actignis TaxID=1189325 RepID=A0A1M7S0M4_9RHOB|nr:ABC transporter ATP-binding protein [Oceanicella actignis]SES93099.1 lipoprotein-releasing system ATP-binding protein [Oceanicella actignis]SHN52043.1 lipoprotein-releasing system ATP-binding protein [Oceanicella actignis]
MSDVPALRLTGIARTYAKGLPGEVRVLSGVDLEVAPGETVALTAPSGAGKSTLLHIAGLLDRPDSGRVEIGGRDAGALGERARTALRRDAIGFVYQFHHLLREFTALENVMLPLLAAGQGRRRARERAMALLDAVGLAGRAAHRPAQLSGGEAQRVAICRALANRPRILLADEPTGNLDPDTAERVFALLARLAREEGQGALIATHNMELAARMDRALRLERGRLVPAS